ncbi:HTH-type transcriptional regulator BhcR [Oricola cellulosilytica]|uniref:IclR family transcriptional regulator n=1 Tax=Oricola cellulosilytica TaxID=1429082 RepID=A0A4R0P8G4_9HYPH|nr:HTH-type transcriptional regulator BhcR [Oricola cellulosilytica]TCD12286.1 IclR family transcriptional regulator [Oricola cellulosilytica]
MAKTMSRARGRPKSFHDKTESVTIQSLDRALAVLKIVSDGSGMSLTEIAEAGDQSPATVYRILTTFGLHAVVDFDERTQLWHVGAGAFRIGSSFLRRTRLVEQSRVVMERMMVESGETANLAIIDHGEVIFISQIETHEPIRAFFRPGTRGPVHASGIGKAILAYQPIEQARATLRGGALEMFTDHTIVAENTLLEELDTIRSRGWAVDDEERTNGMRCIAAPIFNQFAEAVAGVSVSGPTVRMTGGRDAALGELVRQAADEITDAIGGRLPG